MHLPETGPYLKAALLCQDVIEDKQGVLSLIRVVDRFQQLAVGPGAPAEMPPMNIAVYAVLMFVAGEARGSHEVNLTLRRPSGLANELASSTILLEGEDRGANIIAQMQLQLTDQGLHWIEVRLDQNVLLTRMPLRVVFGRLTSPAPGQLPPA